MRDGRNRQLRLERLLEVRALPGRMSERRDLDLWKKPEDSLPPVGAGTAAPVMDALIMNRHSCRRFLKRDVPAETINAMLRLIGNAPTAATGSRWSLP